MSGHGDVPSLDLRHLLADVPTSVAVVATVDGGEPVGCTIGTFVPVSLDPPLVGYLAMASSGTLRAVRRSRSFAVNVLAGDQGALAARFARAVGSRFRGVRWRHGAAGDPHLEGAVVVLDCLLHDVVVLGDHELVVGRVVGAERHPGAAALVFASGRLGGQDTVQLRSAPASSRAS
jgi:flavin reductase (DIM6/NTAB) family NADH-FMN oxidoreductase RutF